MTAQFSPEEHKNFAKACFNETWTYLDRNDRTPDDDEKMINVAHASRYHWSHVGGPTQFARGEWQLSRVYSTVGRAEPAMRHARRCMEICKANSLGAFDHAAAHEAIARAAAVGGDSGERKRNLDAGMALLAQVNDLEDRQIVENDLKSVPACS
ncbi:MAG: hypothetical protein KDA32_05950 [Phycisphaerales bacterium]|nr:hypothetical protein [Phycisphaerales bacterium]